VGCSVGAKFNVTYDSVARLEKGEITELPSHPSVYPFFPKPMMQAYFSKFGLYVVAGLFDTPKEEGEENREPLLLLNKRFPEISTTTIKDVLSVWRTDK